MASIISNVTQKHNVAYPETRGYKHYWLKKCITSKGKSNVFFNSNGNTAIEFALIASFFVILITGLFEFGVYLLKDEITSNAIHTVSNNLQMNPTYYSSMINPSGAPKASLQALLKNYGDGFVDFTAPGNYICIDTSTSSNDPNAARPCTDTHFFTANPNGLGSNSPYYIFVRASVKKSSITPLGNFVSGVKNMQISETSGAIRIGDIIPPPNCQSGDGLQFYNGAYHCYTLIPVNCTKPWQKFIFDGSIYKCVYTSFVVAGGTAWPSTINGGTWDSDYTFIAHNMYNPTIAQGWHNNWTICQRNVTFSVPAGLPPGQIIPRGNLTYPVGCSTACSGNGAWHSWNVSFEHVNIPFNGGKASMDVCMSSGGNWDTYLTDNPTIASEHVSWTAIYVPTPPSR